MEMSMESTIPIVVNPKSGPSGVSHTCPPTRYASGTNLAVPVRASVGVGGTCAGAWPKYAKEDFGLHFGAHKVLA